jgi:hypothetical protein
MKPLNCRFDCPGCLMTFDPDPETCPIEVFDGWEVGNLDTINEWNWSGYRAFKKPTSSL